MVRALESVLQGSSPDGPVALIDRLARIPMIQMAIPMSHGDMRTLIQSMGLPYCRQRNIVLTTLMKVLDEFVCICPNGVLETDDFLHDY